MDPRLAPFKHTYSPEFLAAMEVVLDHEGWGAESDHPADPGGRTRFGVSEAHNGQMPGSLAEALEIYYQRYWRPTKCHELALPLALAVMDSAVLCGTRRAIQWLQAAVNEFRKVSLPEPGADSGHERHNALAVDGVIGPRTLDAVTWVCIGGSGELSVELAARLIWRRQVFHAKRVIARPGQLRWLHGWTNRCSNLMKRAWMMQFWLLTTAL